MDIYVYGEHCTQSGRVAQSGTRQFPQESDLAESGDLWLIASGEREEIVEQMLADLAQPNLSMYRSRCSRNVLNELDGPDVEWSESDRCWLPVVEAE